MGQSQTCICLELSDLLKCATYNISLVSAMVDETNIIYGINNYDKLNMQND